MDNRIEKKFFSLREKNKKAFIAFITAGYPSLKLTEEIVYGLEQSGVDLIELGVPFSDPLADGPTIQLSSAKALEKGVNLPKILAMVKKIRIKCDLPIALMAYYNTVFQYGEEKFVRDCVISGVDGVIIPDLPPEEGEKLIKHARKHDFATVFFIAPNTTTSRIKFIAGMSSGFIYYVSTSGVTGMRKSLPEGLFLNVKRAKKITKKPICVGFGVSDARQVKQIASVADGVIVGSAIIKTINANINRKDLAKIVSLYVKSLKRYI
ncbi:MAG: tryptophan synthase subunit alpha [Candidatus Omnitrophica bacterium]|nr:tryptophan synthase subunit alpha [Candidatus Omnitrophota bacterium]